MASALPIAPDFTGLANQQAGLNQQAANRQTLANRANQIGPTGGMLNWTQGPDGQWTQSVSMGPQQQDQANWANAGMYGASNRLNNADAAYNPWGSTDVTSGLSAMPDSGFGADQKTIDAMRGLQRPTLDARAEARRAQLAAQGITQGSRIGDLTEREIGNNYSDADMKAILAGTQEYGNVFNRGMQARQQGFNENVQGSQLATALRQARENADLNRLSGQGAAYQNAIKPNFSSYATATTAPAADIYGAAGDQYRAQLDALRVAQGNQNANAAASQARSNTNMGLLGGVVQGLGGLSGVGGMLGGAGNWLSGLFGGGQSGYDYDAMDSLANSFNYE